VQFSANANVTVPGCSRVIFQENDESTLDPCPDPLSMKPDLSLHPVVPQLPTHEVVAPDGHESNVEKFNAIGAADPATQG